MVRDRNLRVVVSGHVHQFRVVDTPVRRHVWAPTTRAVLPDGQQPAYGIRRSGVVSLTLDEADVTATMVEPSGLAQLTLGEDIENPYHH